MKRINCILCNLDDTSLMYRMGQFEIVKCKKCGLVYTEPQRVGADHYEEEYFVNKRSHERGYDNYIADKENIIKTSRRRLEDIREYKQTGRLLDLGCATGFFMEVAKNDGWDCFGVDVSKFASNHGKNKLGLNIFHGTLENAKFENNYFDVVTMWDYIEHSSNPLDELQEVNRTLKWAGIIVLTTPDINSLTARVFKNRWVSFKPEEHRCYFSERTIAQILEMAGFKIFRKTWGGQFIKLDVLVRRIERYNRPVGHVLGHLKRKFSLGERSVYIKTPDLLRIYARK